MYNILCPKIPNELIIFKGFNKFFMILKINCTF